MSESRILSLLISLNELTRQYFEKKNVMLDYQNENILHALEVLLADEFPTEQLISYERLIPYGYYLGQIVTNTIPGACWDDVTDPQATIESMSISISVSDEKSSKLMIYPIRRVCRYVADRTSSLTAFYDFTKQLVLRTINIDDVQSGKAYHFQNIVFKIRSESEGDDNATKN